MAQTHDSGSAENAQEMYIFHIDCGTKHDIKIELYTICNLDVLKQTKWRKNVFDCCDGQRTSFVTKVWVRFETVAA